MNLDLSFLNAKLVLPLDYQTVQFWLVGAGGTGSFMAMNLARQTVDLLAARDHLLPRLVSGAIDVSKLDLDAFVDETAA